MKLDPQPPSMPTTAPRVIEVALGDRSYNIFVDAAPTSAEAVEMAADRILASLGDISHALVVTDSAVARPHTAPLADALRNRNLRVDVTEVPSGETSKSVTELARLWDWMLASRCDRRSVVIAIGGGVVGDLAGFAAASYARGLRVVQVPTTLLSMVDSSVGGKTGINLDGAKNMVGAFWQPSVVLVDTHSLSTLPDREFLSGLAEVIKYGVIEDVDFFAWLERHMLALVDRDAGALCEAIARSCESKARVVGEDERETTGRRAILNYGHTFAHAIEATAGYGTFLHGEAVSIGMQMAASLATSLKRVSSDLLQRQTRLLEQARLPITFPEADIPAMLEVMQRDKKVEHGKLRFILPDRIGHVQLVSGIDEPDVVAAIEACRG